MIGVSLPFSWFSDGRDMAPMLRLLKEQGVGSVELRTVRAHHEPDSVLQAAQVLWDAGFQITVHGSVTEQDQAVEQVFGPLSALLPCLRQDRLNITIHPIVGDNSAMLVALSDHILEKGYPVTIALENNRKLPDKTEGDSVALVLDAVTKADRKNVGICFDMGHYAYYVKKNCPDTPDLLPGKEFWSRVIHTHIHALRDLKTHFPLGAYELPLEKYLDKLSFEYFGVYNLELDFPRIVPEWEPEAAIAQSLPYLKSKLHHCARLYDEVRENFDSSYLFHTNGCKWGMDIAFRNSRYLAKTPAKAAELLKDMQLMVLSHGHRDHYEESTLKALCANDTLFLIPDFLEERTLGLGIPAEKLVIAKPGTPVTLFGITFLPFVSSHYRPNGKGVKEYGYYVTAPGCPSMVFPVDIRDFSKKAELPVADVCFSNVWLEDNSIDGWEALVAPWANYMLKFSQKQIFLTHLYEDGRPDDRMWRREHANAVMAELKKCSPETNVTIPQRGQCIPLK